MNTSSIETPLQELVNKLVWTYGEVPYLLGYAAVGYEAALCAITYERGQVHVIKLGDYDLEYLEGRFQWLLAMLTVARLLKSLVSLCPKSARDEYRTIDRENEIKIFLETRRVVKWFPTHLYQEANDHLESVYNVLREHEVPNVDTLVPSHRKRDQLVFMPRGDERKPANLVELFQALANVLEALVKLHAASWMHQDIRWPNMMNHREDNSWFLIDFMDAAHSPKQSSSKCHLSHDEHAPEMFQDNSGHSVDVWAVGRLIETCDHDVFEDWHDKGRERTKFLNHLMNKDPLKRPTAAAALDRLRQLEEECVRQQLRQKGKKQRRM
ncbi:unnamed protein product [Aphanomyces euteiches]